MSSEDILNEIIKSQQLAHAYIFLGPQKDILIKTAIALAKALNCAEQTDSLKSCATCISCVKIEHFNHPDIVHIRPEEKSHQIKIEQIRTLQKEAYLKSIEAKNKVFIVYDAGTMNEEASNCLLKTLEEPPKDVIIILISQSLSVFSPTVISRCQVIKFSQAEIGAENLPENISFIDEFLNAKDAFSSESLAFIKRPKPEQLKTVDLLISFYRDMLVYKFLQDNTCVINTEKLKEIQSLSDNYKPETILAAMKELLRSKDLLQSNVNSKLVADNILAGISAKG